MPIWKFFQKTTKDVSNLLLKMLTRHEKIFFIIIISTYKVHQQSLIVFLKKSDEPSATWFFSVNIIQIVYL